MGDRGSKKAYTGPRTGIYLPTKFGCDRSIVVYCKVAECPTDRQTDRHRQTDRQNGMTIRLTLCDANVTQQTDRQTNKGPCHLVCVSCWPQSQAVACVIASVLTNSYGYVPVDQTYDLEMSTFAVITKTKHS